MKRLLVALDEGEITVADLNGAVIKHATQTSNKTFYMDVEVNGNLYKWSFVLQKELPEG